jgi:hypothetical protein
VSRDDADPKPIVTARDPRALLDARVGPSPPRAGDVELSQFCPGQEAVARSARDRRGVERPRDRRWAVRRGGRSSRRCDRRGLTRTPRWYASSSARIAPMSASSLVTPASSASRSEPGPPTATAPRTVAASRLTSSFDEGSTLPRNLASALRSSSSWRALWRASSTWGARSRSMVKAPPRVGAGTASRGITCPLVSTAGSAASTGRGARAGGSPVIGCVYSPGGGTGVLTSSTLAGTNAPSGANTRTRSGHPRRHLDWTPAAPCTTVRAHSTSNRQPSGPPRHVPRP